MTLSPHGNSPIVTAYIGRTPKSAELYARARDVFPGGVTHDTRFMRPHPLYVVRASGSRKWDADGHEYVDYHGGHGALILGHAHPTIVESVARQVAKGTHYGANHELETQWGELVRDLVPCAELVRFTSSGTESTLMAFRLARAFTGRAKIVRFRGHFHGWHDHVAFGVTDHFDGSPGTGILGEVAGNILLADPNDPEGLRALLDLHAGNVAGMILEPTGSTTGQVPLRHSFLSMLREETARRGIVLIFDEVVTGFRDSLGGAQQVLGITPDLATLGKIVAGGLPGGAVAGRRDILELLDPDVAARRGIEKIPHQGTFNANPLSAAAGVATLEYLRDTDALQRANAFGRRLREETTKLFVAEGLGWAAYGGGTAMHIFTNPNRLPITPESFVPEDFTYKDLKVPRGSQVVTKLRIAARLFGVDLAPWPGAPASAVHDDSDLEMTIDALRNAVRMLREERELD